MPVLQSRLGGIIGAVLPGMCVALFPATSRAGQEIRDSAGVQIAENARALLPGNRGWRVDPKPMLQLGGLGGDSLHEFELVMGVSRLSDGRWAVGVQASNVIRFFDAQGRFVGSAGREGRGPGEFQQIMGVTALNGDTLFVIDLGEVEYFTGDGRFVRQGASRARTSPFAWPELPLPDGSYLGVQWGGGNRVARSGRVRIASAVVRVSGSGQVLDSVGTIAGTEEMFEGGQPYGRRVVYSGAERLAGDGRRFFIHDAVRPQVTEHRLDGREARRIRLSVPVQRVTDAEQDAYKTYVRNSPGEDGRPMPPSMRARAEQALSRAAYAESFPAFGEMLVDRAGNLWVQRYDYRSEFMTPGPVRTQTIVVPTTWYVIDPAGGWLTTVTLPERFTPVEIGVDYVAGLARDADDVEQVRVYRLVKP